MSQRRGHDDRSQGHGSKRARPARKKHLYLVLDDWEKGFTIHKIDADDSFFHSDDDDSDSYSDDDYRYLHEPPAL